MEQSSGKKERLILAAALMAALSLAAAQWFSPISSSLMRGRDVRVVLQGERASTLLVYHPNSASVNAFLFSHPASRKNVLPAARASELSAFVGGESDVFYISLSSAPDMEELWDVMNTWRARPRRFFSSVAWAVGRVSSGGTDISPFDAFSLFVEFSRLDSSNFIVTEAQRRPEVAEAVPSEVSPAPRVEVFNASGKKNLAADAAKYLRARGFDVLTSASYPRRERQTRIVGFSRDTSAALKLRSALSLEELEIRVRPAQRSVADAVVILGEDFAQEKLK